MSGLDSSYDVRLPAPALQPFISHYAGFCAGGMTPGTHAGLPSRHAHLIISLGAPIDVLQMPNPTQRAGRFTALVCGLQDAPATVRRSSSFEGLHVFLRPSGVRAILGVTGAELASCVVDLSDLWGRSSTGLVEQLRNAATWQVRFAVLDDVFIRALIPVERPAAVVWAWRLLAASHGRKSIEGLARSIGWSRPHLTECFRAEFGVTPKTAGRIFRFERACRLIKDARPPLADVAVACGYHDQAHMTRDWHLLAGCSPRAWIASELPFLQDYELSGSDDDI
jgi:AraC-like DNA-binding protein